METTKTGISKEYIANLIKETKRKSPNFGEEEIREFVGDKIIEQFNYEDETLVYDDVWDVQDELNQNVQK